MSENPAPLILYNPYPERDMVPVVRKQTPSNSRTFILNPQENMLLLFPSYMPHAVPDNIIETTRVTLAFNTFYTGSIGNDHDVTLLELP